MTLNPFYGVSFNAKHKENSGFLMHFSFSKYRKTQVP